MIGFDFFQHENIYLVQAIFFVYVLEGIALNSMKNDAYPIHYIKKQLFFSLPYLLLVLSAIFLSFELIWWKAILYIFLTLILDGLVIVYIAFSFNFLTPRDKYYSFSVLIIFSYLSMLVLLLISIYTIVLKIIN